MDQVGPRPENFCKSQIEWNGDPDEKIWIGDRWCTKEYYAKRRADRFLNVNKDPRSFVRNKFSKQKSKARLVRNIEWALDIDTVTDAILEQDRCAISNRPFVYQTGHIDSPSIDRINSEQGYTPDNVMFVGSHVNIMKGALELETFIELCSDIGDNRDNISLSSSFKEIVKTQQNRFMKLFDFGE